MALYHRNRTGEGQSVWTSIFHGSMLYTFDSYLGPDGAPSARPTLDREQMGLDALYRLYQTGDGWIQLAALEEKHWQGLCQAIRRMDLLDDPRFSTVGGRTGHRGALTAELADVFMTDLAVNWRRALRQSGVPVEVSVDTWDGETILFDAELERLGLVAEYEHPLLGRVRQFGNLMSFSGTPTRQGRATPMMGQHTQEVLAELGYDGLAMDDLRARGIVIWPDENYPFGV